MLSSYESRFNQTFILAGIVLNLDLPKEGLQLLRVSAEEASHGKGGEGPRE